MKIFHIADLHLGKKVNEYNMIDSQRYILNQIIEEIKKHQPDAIILAGDIYDRSIPALDAVTLLDEFLKELNQIEIKVYMIAGNHDSKERLGFGSSVFSSSNIYIESYLKEEVFKHELDAKTNIYMIPFIKPSDIRNIYGEEVSTYDEAFAHLIKTIELDETKFNILVAHQFITHKTHKPILSDSETKTLSIGGIDNIDTKHLKAFDYVALGHIHRPQSIGYDYIRYAGSILKYSLSEVNTNKKITVLNINGKDLELDYIDLVPDKDMIHYEDYLEELLSDKYANSDDYIYISLLDEKEIINALEKLRNKFKNLLNISFKRQKLEILETDLDYKELKELNPYALFDEFFYTQNGYHLSDEEKTYIKDVMEGLDETN